MTGRYVIIDMHEPPLVLAVRDDLAEALADVDEPDIFAAYADDPELQKALDDGLYCPDIVVIDQFDDLMYVPYRGEVETYWRDAFSQTWRRLLEVAA